MLMDLPPLYPCLTKDIIINHYIDYLIWPKFVSQVSLCIPVSFISELSLGYVIPCNKYNTAHCNEGMKMLALNSVKLGLLILLSLLCFASSTITVGLNLGPLPRLARIDILFQQIV